jgi:hypothetical protein
LRGTEGLREITGPDPMHIAILIDQDARGLDRCLGVRMRFEVILAVTAVSDIPCHPVKVGGAPGSYKWLEGLR